MATLRFLLVPALLLLTACSGYSVRYDYDPGAAFRGYRSFDWYASSKRAQGRKAEEHPLVDRKVRAAVEQELQAKGFRRESASEPDFLIAYYPVYQTRRTRTHTSVGFGGPGWRRPWGYGVGVRFGSTQTHVTKEGSIVLEIVDGRSNQLVWQATAEGALSNLDDPQESQARITQAVRDLLERFPPR